MIVLISANDADHTSGVFKVSSTIWQFSKDHTYSPISIQLADFGLSRTVPNPQTQGWIFYSHWRFTTGWGPPVSSSFLSSPLLSLTPYEPPSLTTPPGTTLPHPPQPLHRHPLQHLGHRGLHVRLAHPRPARAPGDLHAALPRPPGAPTHRHHGLQPAERRAGSLLALPQGDDLELPGVGSVGPAARTESSRCVQVRYKDYWHGAVRAAAEFVLFLRGESARAALGGTSAAWRVLRWGAACGGYAVRGGSAYQPFELPPWYPS